MYTAKVASQADHKYTPRNVWTWLKPLFQCVGADPVGGQGLGGMGNLLFGGPPNFHKEGKNVARMCTNMPHFST